MSRDGARSPRRKFDPYQTSLRIVGLTSGRTTRGGFMADIHDDTLPDEDPVPVMQQLLDNPFLLLFLGIAMPTVLYIVWGVMEILSLPLAK
jgi:hypothetical protein